MWRFAARVSGLASVTIPCTMALVIALKRASRAGIAIVGYGDFPMAGALSPAITVVDQDPGALGRIAVERLLQRTGDPGAPVRRRTVLPVRLIPRGSGELPPSGNERAVHGPPLDPGVAPSPTGVG